MMEVGMSLNPDYCFNTGAGFENLAWGIAIGGEKVMFGYGVLLATGSRVLNAYHNDKHMIKH